MFTTLLDDASSVPTAYTTTGKLVVVMLAEPPHMWVSQDPKDTKLTASKRAAKALSILKLHHGG